MRYTYRYRALGFRTDGGALLPSQATNRYALMDATKPRCQRRMGGRRLRFAYVCVAASLHFTLSSALIVASPFAPLIAAQGDCPHMDQARIRRALTSDNIDRRLAAIRIVADDEQTARRLLRIVRELLNDNDLEIRLYAAIVIIETDGDLRVTPVFVSALESTPRARMLALRGMLSIPNRHSALVVAVPALVKIVKQHKDSAETALVLLGRCGPGAREACPALVEIITNSSLDETYPSMRLGATRALGKIGTASLPYLVKALDVDDSTAQQLAIQAIGMLGFGAKEAVPQVERFRRSADPILREVAEKCLERIKGGRD
jgi:HEAT repeat protein